MGNVFVKINGAWHDITKFKPKPHPAKGYKLTLHLRGDYQKPKHVSDSGLAIDFNKKSILGNEVYDFALMNPEIYKPDLSTGSVPWSLIMSVDSQEDTNIKQVENLYNELKDTNIFRHSQTYQSDYGNPGDSYTSCSYDMSGIFIIDDKLYGVGKLGLHHAVEIFGTSKHTYKTVRGSFSSAIPYIPSTTTDHVNIEPMKRTLTFYPMIY